MRLLKLFTGEDQKMSKHNCLTYTYQTLEQKGYKLPTEWRGYTKDDFEYFSNNASKLLARKVHISFFESFCTQVDEAKKDDIILTDTSVGVAINKYKYLTLRLRGGKPCLVDINKGDMIMRITDV